MNKKIDEFRVKFEQGGVVRDAAFRGPVTFVTLDFGGLSATGIARCGQHDEFHTTTGVTIAYRRALKKLAEMDTELAGNDGFVHIGSLEYIKELGHG